MRDDLYLYGPSGEGVARAQLGPDRHAADCQAEALLRQVKAGLVTDWSIRPIELCEVPSHHVNGDDEAVIVDLIREEPDDVAVVERRVRGGAVTIELLVVVVVRYLEQRQPVRMRKSYAPVK